MLKRDAELLVLTMVLTGMAGCRAGPVPGAGAIDPVMGPTPAATFQVAANGRRGRSFGYPPGGYHGAHRYSNAQWGFGQPPVTTGGDDLQGAMQFFPQAPSHYGYRQRDAFNRHFLWNGDWDD